MTESNSEIYS